MGNRHHVILLGSVLIGFLTSSAGLGAASQTEAAAHLDLARAPPELSQIVLTPRGKASARIEVSFREEARLPSAIKTLHLTANGADVTLTRTAARPRSFAATTNFDFDQFIIEQQRRVDLARMHAKVPIFDGRAMTGVEPVRFVEPAAIRETLARGTSLSIPTGAFNGIPYAVDPAQELMITDLSVVEDPSRTFDICTGKGTPGGAWTFQKLMTDMANQPLTGVDPADLVEQWAKTWETNQSINGFTVQARPNIDPVVLNPWPRTSGGKLDLAKAPLRLLAIVNRVDLRTGGAYVPGKAGEGRFVFGVVNNATASTPSTCNTIAFTVIVEYGVPISGCTEIRAWGQQWHALGSLTLGTATFNNALQAITDQFTKADADPAKPNGSALDQLRTDEIALTNTSTPEWELRQFQLNGSDHLLHESTVAQTPDLGIDDSSTLHSYIQMFPAQIASGTPAMPNDFPGATPFLAASALNGLPDWIAPGIPKNIPPPPNPSNDNRQLLALGTCNGCHGTETNTSFLQVFPRNPGTASTLSLFLLGSPGTLLVPGTETVPDVWSGAPRVLGDLLRRQTDLDALVNQSCRAGGILGGLKFKPLNMSE
jgi:hypothetical protein